MPKRPLTYLTISNQSDLDSPSPLAEIYFQGYKLWKDIFTKTFQGLIDPDFILYSDDFEIQDRIGILFDFDKDKALGTIAYSEFYTHSPIDMDRSYFKHYPQSSIEMIKREYKKISVISNLVVSPEKSNYHDGKLFSSYLIGLGVKEFLESTSDILITITRNDRKTDQLVGHFGGIVLCEHEVHGRASNVMAITKENARAAFARLTPQIHESIHNLFINLQNQPTPLKENFL